MQVEVLDGEDHLRMAMLQADVRTLDDLLAPSLLFTNHLGQLLRKEDTLAACQSVRLAQLTSSERVVRRHGSGVIVSARVHLAGTWNDSPAEGDFRFTRVWARSPDKVWRVVAAHATLVS